MSFTLDPRLAQDTAFVSDWPLCGLYRMDDRRYAWIVLVPRRASVSEPFDLPEADQTQLWRETMHAAALLKRDTGCGELHFPALVVLRRPHDPVAFDGHALEHERRTVVAAQSRQMRAGEAGVL